MGVHACVCACVKKTDGCCSQDVDGCIAAQIREQESIIVTACHFKVLACPFVCAAGILNYKVLIRHDFTDPSIGKFTSRSSSTDISESH